MLFASNRTDHGCILTTAIIWGGSTGMLAIDLLSTSAQSELAIAIVVATVVSTMTVLAIRAPRHRHAV